GWTILRRGLGQSRTKVLERCGPRGRTVGAVDPLARDQVGPGEYRATMEHLATGVAVVTSELDGEDVGMTATALCSVSLEPPTLLLSVGHGSRMAEALSGLDTWAVS